MCCPRANNIFTYGNSARLQPAAISASAEMLFLLPQVSAPEELASVTACQPRVGQHPLIFPSRTSLAVQWLGLHTSTEGDTGSIPGRGTKIPHATWCGQKTKKKFPSHHHQIEGPRLDKGT